VNSEQGTGNREQGYVRVEDIGIWAWEVKYKEKRDTELTKNMVRVLLIKIFRDRGFDDINCAFRISNGITKGYWQVRRGNCVHL
jgi:hypothetical protein